LQPCRTNNGSDAAFGRHASGSAPLNAPRRQRTKKENVLAGREEAR
jgi:hypothetical protein